MGTGRRIVTVCALSALAILVPPAQVASSAPAPVPDTVSQRLAGLPAAADADGAWLESQAVETPMAFSLVGFEVPPGMTAEMRVSEDGRTWTPWHEVHAGDLADGPDLHTAEARRRQAPTSEPVWVGEATHLQTRVSGGHPRDLAVHLVDSAGLSRSVPERVFDAVQGAFAFGATASAAEDGRPAVVSRAEWGADESLNNGSPRYADEVRFGVVHHTATSNDYQPEDGPAIVRGIHRYHTQSNGWDDIGYNLLVDRYGTIYEGRAGGLDRAVIGAHAAGFNEGSYGVSVIGNFEHDQPTQAAVDALAAVVGWKQALHGIEPGGQVTVTSKGSPKYASGTTVTLDTLSTHRDVGETSCPGELLYAAVEALKDGTTPTVEEDVGSDREAADDVAHPFVDVNGSIHELAIGRLYNAEIVSGCSTKLYCPRTAVSRAQMASFLSRLFGLEDVESQAFSDVPADSQHAGAIGAVAAAGIASGFPDGTYQPGEPLTRRQMALLLARALELEPVWGFRFDDIPDDPAVPRSLVNAIAEAGITQGCDAANFCPHDPLTRDQMASLLSRTRDLLLDASGDQPQTTG